MFDADKFIECVRARPTLWDVRLHSYSDKIERDRTWQELGQQMYKEWSTFDDDRTESKVRELKNKWRNIRDNYLKYVNQTANTVRSSAAAPRKKRKYLYADRLAFLQNTVGKRRTIVARKGGASGNEVAIQNDDNDDYIHPDEEFTEGEYVEYDDDEDLSAKMALPSATEPPAPVCFLDLPETTFAQTPSTEYSRLDDMTQFQVSIMKKLDALKKPEEEDPDKYFLISILPDYKKLNEEEKLDFRINCLHFFRDVKNKKSQNKPLKTEC